MAFNVRLLHSDKAEVELFVCDITLVGVKRNFHPRRVGIVVVVEADSRLPCLAFRGQHLVLHAAQQYTNDSEDISRNTTKFSSKKAFAFSNTKL